MALKVNRQGAIIVTMGWQNIINKDSSYSQLNNFSPVKAEE